MRHYVILYMIAIVAMASGCSAYEAPFNSLPTLSVEEALDITRNEATVAGAIADNGGQGLTSLRFEWWASNGGAVLRSPLLTPDSGRVEYRLRDLKPGVTYSYRLRGDNGRVEVTSNDIQFTTLSNVIPTVSPLIPLAKGPASVIASFVIEDNGGEDIIEAGCHIRNIDSGKTVDVTASLSEANAGNIILTMTGLDKMANLELTPYAANTIGEATGSAMLITTDNSISTTSPGTLSQLMGEDRYGYTSLSFSGQMNGDDIRTIREMAGLDFYGHETGGQLTAIDLTDVNIVEGGSNYIESRAIEADVIGYGMFQDLARLQSIMLPLTAKRVDEQAFKNCSSLATITIPASASAIGQSDGCTSLSSIQVSAANKYFKSIDGVLFNADATKIIWFPLGKDGNYTLPSSVESIGEYAFRNCRITSFTMPDDITEIGMGAFYGSSVETVTLSNNLATIPQATFQQCRKLKCIHIGSETSLIGEYVFDGCPLSDIYIAAAIPPVCYNATFNSSYPLLKSCTLHVPESSLARYRAHKKWGNFENITK